MVRTTARYVLNWRTGCRGWTCRHRLMTKAG